MKIGAGIVFYNDAEGLKRTISSLKDFDVIICTDGAWKEFEDEGLSTDGSREIVTNANNTVLLDAAGMMTAEKQEFQLRYSDRYDLDALVLIDSDEYLTHFDRDTFEESLMSSIRNEKHVYHCDFEYYDLTWQHTRIPRVLWQPQKCQYLERHNQIFAGTVPQITSDIVTINGINMKHEKNFRPAERESYNKEWNLAHPKH